MKKIILYGAGANLVNFISSNINILNYVDAIIDNSTSKYGMNFYGFIIQSKEHLKELHDDTIIAITSDKYYDDIKKDIQDINDKLRCMRLANALELVLPSIGKCNLCNSNVYNWSYIGEDNRTKYSIIGNGKRLGGCPICGCYDRVRWQYYVIENYTNMMDGNCNILHFAPERMIQLNLRKKNVVTYITGDIELSKADYKIDITNIQFDDNKFDYIIANHILEHVLDEEKAIKELIRCLKLNGSIMLSFPICMDVDTLEDDKYDNEYDRTIFYGQKDHVRLYGRDYKERLEAYGLKVGIYSPEVLLDSKTVEQFGFIKDDIVLLCKA
ncbi:MAG: methyltransferase domain-containing protein [Anaerolineaceae bacterium]|nr:MAG: methyltransferase domain-containing protein [Anaerolineaceae bacterium]